MTLTRSQENNLHRTIRFCSSLCLAILLAATGRAQAPSGYTITTVAGNNTSGFSGDAGAATAAQLAGPYGIAVDKSGNLYIADSINQRVRKVAGTTISTVAGTGTSGFTGDGAAATSGQIGGPVGVAVDGSGNFFIAEITNHKIRKVTSGGTISTFAGSGTAGYSGNGGAAASANLFQPNGVAVDAAGNVYIADTGNHVVRKVGTDGNISTFAGISIGGFFGDGGPAISAQLASPAGVAFDAAGNLYISDTGNHRIRVVNPAGIIQTIAGSGTAGFSGDNGPALAARLNRPIGLTVDAGGSIFVADYNNSRIRKISASGVITTIAGNGLFGFSGDNGPAINASLRFPSGVAVDSNGNLYVADDQNNAIRLLTPASAPVGGGLPSIKSNGIVGASSFGAFSTAASGSWIEIYGSNLAASTRAWTGADFRGFAAPTVLDRTSVNVGTQSAFVYYVSPNQLNVQLPSGLGTGPQQITVTTAAGTSAPFSFTLNSAQPGLFAPPSLLIGGKQYVGALFPDGSTYALPTGAVSGITSRPAKPGDTVTLYGVGFGPVNPAVSAGQTTQYQNSLTLPFQLLFGQTQATPSYFGLAPGAVGLYQFNVTVPNVGANDALPLTFSLGGVTGTQTLYIAVQK